MSFMVLPPEINSLLMYSGAGSGPMIEAAAAWDGPPTRVRRPGHTGMNNSGNANTFVGNPGSVNTGFWNSGNPNTGIGSATNTGATTSGFGNTGTNVSGFFNTPTGPGASGVSGFFNHASGGSFANGSISGFFNTGFTAPFPPFPSGVISGADSGLLNTGTGVAGLFSITRLLKNL